MALDGATDWTVQMLRGSPTVPARALALNIISCAQAQEPHQGLLLRHAQAGPKLLVDQVSPSTSFQEMNKSIGDDGSLHVEGPWHQPRSPEPCTAWLGTFQAWSTARSGAMIHSEMYHVVELKSRHTPGTFRLLGRGPKQHSEASAWFCSVQTAMYWLLPR